MAGWEGIAGEGETVERNCNLHDGLRAEVVMLGSYTKKSKSPTIVQRPRQDTYPTRLAARALPSRQRLLESDKRQNQSCSWFCKRGSVGSSSVVRIRLRS